ncbi:Host attachment protein [Sphingomonas sp. Leaf407]|uniref:host attachment family protein n=1 Tax=unclassified Sphingomonas TaxID=196159 RepID=UPI0006FA47CE|nr:MULTISPECIES: host attachment family protein [unclassified Sphingomonas]KQN36963.1 Host attachment protein [Sphingomonas sp. Leaf42]KQT30390.1 Host attachment protein [Sphingomonas sp. Leaf407]
MRIPHDACVLVADGRKMLFFRNKGDADAPNLIVEDQQQQANPADRHQKTDAAGQGSSIRGGNFASGGGSIGETDYHQQAEDRFAAQAAEELKRRALANEFETLIVVAPPKTLGEMRKHYHQSVSARLAGELDKDLTGHPVDQIEKLLTNA